MKLVSSIILVLYSLSAHAISAEELLEKVNKKYANITKIEYNTVYELYKGYKSTTVHSSYEGYLYRDGSKVYQKIDGTEIINGSDFSLKISHQEKAMALGLSAPYQQNDVDLSNALKNCKEKKVEDKGSYYRLKLVYNAISAAPVSVLYLRVNKEDFSLLQVDVYYSTEQDFSTTAGTTDYAKPHLKIRYKNITSTPQDKSYLFELSRYLKSSNNLLSPTGECEGYYLIDNRVK